jgi:hypothetical protein
MDDATNEAQTIDILREFYTQTGGDLNKSVSMWDVGEKLGLEKFRIEDLCMGMASEGLLEIKNLSGGMGLTEVGLERVQGLDSAGGSGQTGDVGSLLGMLEGALPDLGLGASAQKDMTLDIQTLRLQLARSKPLPGVQSAALAEIRRVLEMSSAEKAGPLIEALNQI